MLKKLMGLFKKKPFTLPPQDKLKIWGILSGPYSREEVEDPYLPEGLNYMLLCKASYKEEVFDHEFWFETAEEARAVVQHFKEGIDPLELKVNG